MGEIETAKLEITVGTYVRYLDDHYVGQIAGIEPNGFIKIKRAVLEESYLYISPKNVTPLDHRIGALQFFLACLVEGAITGNRRLRGLFAIINIARLIKAGAIISIYLIAYMNSWIIDDSLAGLEAVLGQL